MPAIKNNFVCFLRASIIFMMLTHALGGARFVSVVRAEVGTGQQDYSPGSVMPGLIFLVPQGMFPKPAL